MCGRFYIKGISFTAIEYFQQMYGIDLEVDGALPPGPEFLPWNDIAVVINDGSAVKLRSMFWNLVPAGEKEFKPPKTWFNTRFEKLEGRYQDKLLRYQRCIVPVGKFIENKEKFGQPVYQSKRIGGKNVRKKESYEFYDPESALLLLGGIYDVWQMSQYSCSIITVDANHMVGEIHPRMPFILPADLVKVWLDKSTDDSDYLREQIKPAPVERLHKRQLWPGGVGQAELFG